jgi:hypothetical protein
MDTLKNQFIGRLQYPHSYFIENGIHSITMVPHKPDYSADGNARVHGLISVIEKLIRIHD